MNLQTRVSKLENAMPSDDDSRWDLSLLTVDELRGLKACYTEAGDLIPERVTPEIKGVRECEAMSLENRVSKLEAAQLPTGGSCPVCDAPARDEEKPIYDESIWSARDYLEINPSCVHCGRPRRIMVQLIERRGEATI